MILWSTTAVGRRRYRTLVKHTKHYRARLSRMPRESLRAWCVEVSPGSEISLRVELAACWRGGLIGFWRFINCDSVQILFFKTFEERCSSGSLARNGYLAGSLTGEGGPCGIGRILDLRAEAQLFGVHLLRRFDSWVESEVAVNCFFAETG